jgi:hypothetical protein
MISVYDIKTPGPACSPQYCRIYNSHNILKFQEMLSYEQWEDVFINDDVNYIFNAFLSIYLRIFYAYFIKKKIIQKPNHNSWITCGIRTS